ncbi:MAG: hypothetical protein ABI162_15200 [Luteolibacter sp.]
MKPHTQSITTLVIAVVFGISGYFIGKSQSSGKSSNSGTDASVFRTDKTDSPARRVSTSLIDPKELRVKLEAEKSPLARLKLATQNLEDWVAKNPEDAMAWLLSQQPSERRDELIRIALAQYAEIDPKGAAAWASKNLTGNDLNNSLISIAENWAEQDGLGAATWFLTLPASPQRNAAVENIFFSWASNEPEAALQYIKANPGLGELTSVVQRAALAGWAKSDPQSAATTSLALSQSNHDPTLFANTLANWATMDLEGSSQWLFEHLKPGDERASAVPELATIYAQQSPEAGLIWLGKLNAGAERDAAASILAATWSRADAAAAAKWAASQTASTLSPESTSAIFRNFLREDPAAFDAWRNTLPNGPLKDQASQISAAPDEKQ